jgi:hypothetical protein
MGKGDQPRPRDDRAEKIQIAAAVFYAVRLFRQPPADQAERELYAAAAAADADALLSAAEGVS